MPTAIALDWKRCPDGAQIIMEGDVQMIAPRTKRAETRRIVVSNVADGLVLKFVAARGDQGLVDFVAKHGCLGSPMDPGWTGVEDEPLEFVRGAQKALQAKLALQPAEAPAQLQFFNPAYVKAGLEARGGDAPWLTLRPVSLYTLMDLEVMLVLAGETHVETCAHCFTPFAVGSASGKRTGSVYCSTRCRVAAHRAAKRK